MTSPPVAATADVAATPPKPWEEQLSTVKQMADAEAEAAEAEAEAEDEDETTATPDAEPDPEPDAEPDSAPSSNVTMEKALAAMEKENTRHAKRVAEIMGADFELVHVCPGCVDFAAGFTLTPPDDSPPVMQGEEWERCTKCNGHGFKLTGALPSATPTNTCRNCAGQGFTEVILPPPSALVPQSSQPAPNADVVNLLRTQGYMVIEPPAPAPPVNAQVPA